MPDRVRAALRAATEATHRRLHAIPVLDDLAQGRLTRAGYAALLRRKLGFHATLEARLAQAPSLAAYGIDLDARRRSHLLEADLAWLGADAAAPAAPIPRFATAAAALGGVYVAEGATLGGRQLARALDAILPAGPDGRRFLLGHGERHGEMWRACCAALERCGATEPARAAMIRGASATFAAFEAWFTMAEADLAQAADAAAALAGASVQPIAPRASRPLPP